MRDTDDPKVVANAVEELLRYLSIIQNGQRRVAAEDIEIAGEVIRAGEGIIIDLGAGELGCQTRLPNPSGSTFIARAPVSTSRSATAGTSAWVSSLPAPSCRSSFTRCCAASPRWSWPCRSRTSPFKHDRLAYGVYELPVTW